MLLFNNDTMAEETQANQNIVTIKKSNVKLAFIIVVVFIIGLFIGSFLLGGITGRVITQTITTQEASDRAVQYINENLVQPNTTASFVSVDEVGELYNITISYQGKQYNFYLTKDGSYLFPSTPFNISVSLPEETEQPSQVKLSVDDDPQKGPSDAKVTIIEFSDFQCPYCKRAEPTLNQIFDEYGNNVRLVYRDFPLSFHQYAQKAAEASQCAFEQGKYWEYHDILYENQETLDVASLKQYAKDLGLDSAKFDSCLDSGKYESEVEKDFQDGQAAGVSATPAFFILDRDGNVVENIVGAQPFSVFKEAIDPLLE